MNPPHPSEGPLRLHVVSRRHEAMDIVSLELARVGGGDLPDFTAGAHIDVELHNGLRRSYSLCNDPTERDRYVIAVHRSITSRGGSSWIHDALLPGAEVTAWGPRNDFPLEEAATTTVFVAGGIGITPMLTMVGQLTKLGRPWEMHFAVRTRGQAAFVDQLDKLAADAGGRFNLHVDDERGERLDIGRIVRDSAPDAHLYCCGPAPMLDAFLEASADSADRVHVERFTAIPQPEVELTDAFDVHLAKSDLTFRIDPENSILETLRAETDLDVNWSCGEGICGTCELRVISGKPLHRDSVLSQAERDASHSMMICVSRSAGGPLVLDL